MSYRIRATVFTNFRSPTQIQDISVNEAAVGGVLARGLLTHDGLVTHPQIAGARPTPLGRDWPVTLIPGWPVLRRRAGV